MMPVLSSRALDLGGVCFSSNVAQTKLDGRASGQPAMRRGADTHPTCASARVAGRVEGPVLLAQATSGTTPGSTRAGGGRREDDGRRQRPTPSPYSDEDTAERALAGRSKPTTI